jgi:isochorismate synthase
MMTDNPDHTDTTGSEVLFHRPGSPVLERMVPDSEGRLVFRLHPWEQARDHRELVFRGRSEVVTNLIVIARPTVKRTARAVDGTRKEDHIDRVIRAQQAISQGPLRKVVLSSQLQVEVAGLEGQDIVQRLALAHPDSFSWTFKHPTIGTWFGSSPEPLVQGQWPELRTACLAGTRMAHLGAVSDPWTSKEQEEQQLVTDGALTALDASACENVRTGDRETIQYGPIEHLRTWIDFKATRPLNEVIKALHPTPAVGGTPRAEALDFIANNEGHDRAYYTGWVGLEEDDDVAYYVNLRCAHLRDGVLTAYAGGGITAASKPAAEWDETRNKLRAVLDPIVHWAE